MGSNYLLLLKSTTLFCPLLGLKTEIIPKVIREDCRQAI